MERGSPVGEPVTAEAAAWHHEARRLAAGDEIGGSAIGIHDSPDRSFNADGDYDLLVSCPDKPSNVAWMFENTTGDTARAPLAFLPVRPITQADQATVTERVRRRVIRWFRLTRLLDPAAAADMLAWVNSGFSVDASVRIALNRPRCAELFFRSLKHLLRYCARPLSPSNDSP